MGKNRDVKGSWISGITESMPQQFGEETEKHVAW